jgi:hypothetical protein
MPSRNGTGLQVAIHVDPILVVVLVVLVAVLIKLL